MIEEPLIGNNSPVGDLAVVETESADGIQSSEVPGNGSSGPDVENSDNRREITSINAGLLLVVTQNIAIPLELALRAIQYSGGDGCHHGVAISHDQMYSIARIERYVSFFVIAFSYAPTKVYTQELYQQKNNWFTAAFPYESVMSVLLCTLVVDFNLYGYLQQIKTSDQCGHQDRVVTNGNSSSSALSLKQTSWLTTAVVVGLDGLFFSAGPMVMSGCLLSCGAKPGYDTWIAFSGWYTNAYFNWTFVKNPAINNNLVESIFALIVGYFSIYNNIKYLEVVSIDDLGCSDAIGHDKTFNHYRQLLMWVMYCTTIPRLSYIMGDNIVSTLKKLADKNLSNNMHDSLARWSIVGYGWETSSLSCYQKIAMNVTFALLYPAGIIYALSQGAGDSLGDDLSDVDRVVSYVTTTITVISCLCILLENNASLMDAAQKMLNGNSGEIHHQPTDYIGLADDGDANAIGTGGTPVSESESASPV